MGTFCAQVLLAASSNIVAKKMASEGFIMAPARAVLALLVVKDGEDGPRGTCRLFGSEQIRQEGRWCDALQVSRR